MSKVPPASPPFLAAKWHGGSQTPTLSVIHSAVMPCVDESVINMVNAFRGSRPASAHYGIGPVARRQYVGDHTVAYHCGYNTNSLGYEMCDMPGPVPDDPPGTARYKALKRVWRWTRSEQRKMLRNTANLVAQNHLAYGIPIRRMTPGMLLKWAANGKRAEDGGITTHAMMSKVFKASVHWDPGFWPEFLFVRMVKQEARKIRRNFNPPPPPPPPPAAIPVNWLRVVHAPLHGTTAKVSALRKALTLGKRGVVAFSEAYRPAVHAFLLAYPRWKAIYGDTDYVDARKRHVGWDVTLMVHRHHKILESGSFKMSNEVEAALKVAPERWAVWALLGPVETPMLVLAMHPNAVPEPGTARGREYVKSFVKVEAFIKSMEAKHPGLAVTLLGDLNHRDDDSPLSPAAMLTRLGMKWRSVRLDWLARKNADQHNFQKITDNDQDHPWLLADLNWK